MEDDKLELGQAVNIYIGISSKQELQKFRQAPREGLFKKILVWRLTGGKRVTHVFICRKVVPGRRNTQYKALRLEHVYELEVPGSQCVAGVEQKKDGSKWDQWG